MKDGEIVGTGIIEQTHLTIQNLIAILEEAGYGLEHVVRCGVWLTIRAISGASTRSIKAISASIRQPRACVQSHMMVDCKVEIDCVAYKGP
jgi:enamine deaminase RidA (YjgF/YER057c/UK114 family)